MRPPRLQGSHRDRRGEPVIAVNDGDREEGADCLQDQTCPLNQIDFGSAGENALATRIQRAFKRGGDLTLCGLLAQVAGPESKSQLQRLAERAWLMPSVAVCGPS